MRTTGELVGRLVERLGDFLEQPVTVRFKAIEIQDNRVLLLLQYVDSDGVVLIEQERSKAVVLREGDAVTYWELTRPLSEVFSISVPRGGGTMVRIGDVVEEVAGSGDEN